MLNKKRQQYIRTPFGTIAVLLFFLFISFFSRTILFADNLISPSFQVENPTTIQEGGKSTSSSFQLLSSLGEFVIGESSSGSFTGHLGFLYFPIATSPSVSATAGNAQVSLSWTSSTATLANVTHYEVGVSTSLGGTYTYTNVGNVLAYIKTSLTNSTTYYFKVRVFADGILLATSSPVSATPIAPIVPGGGGGGGGGGSSSGGTGDAGIIFSGRAFPLSKVNILKDGQLVISTIAGPDSNFTVTLSGLSSGNYNFSVYGIDNKGILSSSFTFPIFITAGATTNIGGIFIAPTISVDKSQFKKGDTVVVFGQSAQSSEVTININSEPEFFVKKATDANGVYLLNFDSSVLALGKHTARSKSVFEDEISPFSASVSFSVGSVEIPLAPSGCGKKGDLNADCRVNLVDFSIAAFWYKKTLSQTFVAVENSSLNGDSKVDLVDFSIMAFNWTG